MKKLPLLLVVLATFLCAPVVQSQELTSCEDLVEIANALDELIVVFDENAGAVVAGGEADGALRELVDALAEVAVHEQSSDLFTSIEDLDAAWQDMNSTSFLQALQEVVASFDRLIERDCHE